MTRQEYDNLEYYLRDLQEKMKDRDEDCADPKTMVDKGYSLAVSHMNNEIEEILECLKYKVDDMYPLYGIIYNWKGLKEENYLYTGDELQRFDRQLFEDCNKNPGTWNESVLIDCAWKTWSGRKISAFDELTMFLIGGFNDGCKEDPDWYWEDMLDNDLYGEKSNTMREACNSIIGGK